MSSLVKNIVKIGTHSGRFHCDDVFSCVMLQKLDQYKNAQIVRSRDQSVLRSCDIVLDVGGVFDHAQLMYDHHQKSFNETMRSVSEGKYPFDVKLSSCGLIYYFYGHEIIKGHDPLISSEQLDFIFRLFYRNYVMPLDGIDNGVQLCDCGTQRYSIRTDLSSRVAYCNPSWYEPSLDLEQMDLFRTAMDIVKHDFDCTLQYYLDSVLREYDIVSSAYSDRFSVDESGQIMFIDGGCPFSNVLSEVETVGEIIFVIYRNSHDHSYRIQGVSDDSPYNLRWRISEELRGLVDEQLETRSGISGLKFVHSNGFMASGYTYEAVLNLAKMSLQSYFNSKVSKNT